MEIYGATHEEQVQDIMAGLDVLAQMSDAELRREYKAARQHLAVALKVLQKRSHAAARAAPPPAPARKVARAEVAPPVEEAPPRQLGAIVTARRPRRR